ncbi:signal transduction histidine kinase [Streptomyces sp. SAI-135]|nr:signal transduction histidine kinase [Streptomyces sp. SAI-090]MDH6548576.1 signal transduction histidine kinase [Streptomyces sp. SAI-041]MDH6567670.1 signal transduction histidine kinase [Streptomyces sp. SAI-117]MDH6619528.1 signal transduction histidine kinase [Streptomyces sp. SAI-135]
MPDTGVMTDTAPVEPRASFDSWGPYALLGAGVVAAAVSARPVGMGRSAMTVSAVLVVAGALLQVWWGRVRRGRPGPSRTGVCLYFLRWGLGFVLTWLNPFFAFYAVTGYYTAARELPRRLVMPGLFLTAITMAGSEVGGMPPHGPLLWTGFFLVLGLNMGLVSVFTRFALQEQERARVQAETIAELERTNTALQQALDENAALHAQLLVQAREAGVADERRRLAAEIHDTLAQGLTGIIAQLQVVVNTPDENQAREHVHRAMDLARHSLGEARRSVHNLAPVALADAGLPEALKQTVTDWGERTGVRAEFTVTGTAEQLHDEVSATLLRIAQEALSNAARHAHAARLGVTLSFLTDEVILDIRDDGGGFDPLALPARTRTGGFGLDGMRARAERIAGSLTVESEPGHGTALSARVPLVRHDR